MKQFGKLHTADGIELYWQSWQPQLTSGVIVLIHGLADHGTRYEQAGQFLASHGWAVYAVDLRGHGQSSDGHQRGRVHVDHFSDYASDVSAIISHAKQRHPDVPLVILGHSMGGLISLSYALNHPDELDGAVISSPLLGAHPDARPPAILNLLARLLAHIKPRLLFPSNLDSSAISRDPAVVRAYIDDPLVSEKVSARWYVELTKAMEDLRGRAAQLQIPTLLMVSGNDRLVDPLAAPLWAEAVADNLLKLVVWEEFFHEMFNEPEKDKVHACVLDWLSHHFPNF